MPNLAIALPLLFAAIATTATVAGLSEAPTSSPASPAASPPAVSASCAAISPASLDAYARTIEKALKSAQKDARANGTTGTYSVAATNARDMLNSSLDRIRDGSTKLRGSDPRTTTYAEGGMVKEHVRSTLEWMPRAGHWALISAIYHKSTDARDAFEGTITALEEGNRLYAESGRCYLSGYL